MPKNCQTSQLKHPSTTLSLLLVHSITNDSVDVSVFK